MKELTNILQKIDNFVWGLPLIIIIIAILALSPVIVVGTTKYLTKNK